MLGAGAAMGRDRGTTVERRVRIRIGEKNGVGKWGGVMTLRWSEQVYVAGGSARGMDGRILGGLHGVHAIQIPWD